MEDKKYTLEDIETLRQRSDVSYEEAVALLEKYSGDVTRALIELEKRGAVQKGIRVNLDGKAADTLKTLWDRGLSARLTISKDDRALVDLPVVLWLLALALGWRFVVVAAVIALVTGCKVELKRTAPAASPKTAESPAASEAAPEPEPAPEDAAPAPVQAEATETDDGYHSITIE